MAQERKLTTDEAVEYSGLPKKTLQHAVRTGRVTYYAVGSRGPWFFDPADIDEWLESMKIPAEVAQ